MPSRSIDREFVFRTKTLYVNGCSSSPDPWIDRSYRATWVDNFSGVDNPTWREQISAHQNATTAASGNRTTVSSSPADRHKYLPQSVNCGGGVKGDQIFAITGDILLPWAGSYVTRPLPDISLSNAAAGAFYGKVQDALSPVKGGTILAELHKTLRLLKSPIRTIRNQLEAHSARSLSITKSIGRRGKATPGKVRSAIRDISESYLTCVFGIQPSVRDANDVLKYLAHNYDRLRQEYRRVSASSARYTLLHENYTVGGNVPDSNYDFLNCRRVMMTEKVVQSGEVRLAVGDFGRPIARDLGLAPSAFLPTLWEVLPWSWFIDYAANIGAMIDAFSVPASNMCWVSRSLFTHQTTVVSGNEVDTRWRGTCGSLVIKTSNFERLKPLSLGVPSFQWDPKLGFRRLLNIGAVAVVLGTRQKQAAYPFRSLGL